MAKKLGQEIFDRVFSDAHVIDIDFSQWDKRIELWVLADHYENWRSRKPLVVVSFVEVQEFIFSTGEYRPGTDGHLQWRVDSCEVEEQSNQVRIRLWGSRQFPVAQITCNTIDIKSVPSHILDKCFPGWSKPNAGLARPGLEAWHDKLTN